MANKKQKITKDMPFTEVMDKYPEAVEVMINNGLHCVGCAAASFETIEQGAKAHGIDAKKLIDDMNKAIEKKPKKK